MPLFPFGGSQFKPYQIKNSLRFRRASSTYLTRVCGTPTNSTVWTFSTWVRRANIGADHGLFGYDATSNPTESFYIRSDDKAQYSSQTASSTNGLTKITNQLFRDPTGWFHFHATKSGPAKGAAGNVRVWISGKETTSWGTNSYNGTQSLVPDYVNVAGNVLDLGRAFGLILDGYLADTNFVDGLALDPACFGMTDPNNPSNWIPRAPLVPAYGNNGFRLEYRSSANLGLDTSGKDNNWTLNNFSATDQSNDSPTNVYPIMNALSFWTPSIPSQYAYPTNGGLFLQATNGTANYCGYKATMPVTGSSGKFYFEVNWVSGGGTGVGSSFYILNADTGVALTGTTLDTTGTVVGYAVDCSAGVISWYKNGVSQGTLYSFTPGTPLLPALVVGNGPSLWINFGQSAFIYTPPTGFKPLCSANLPAVSIKRPNLFFDVLTWSGDSVSPKAITGLSFFPDIVWGKTRSSTRGNAVFDSVRGFGSGKELSTDQTVAEGGLSSSAYGYVSAALSNGFQVTSGSTSDDYWNTTGNNYAAWAWKRGATQGVDIVTYNGDGVNGRMIPHSLGSIPAMIIIKGRNASTGSSYWLVWHKSAGQAGIHTSAAFDLTGFTGAVYLNSTLGSSAYGFDAQINGVGGTYVAYLFAEVPGFSKFGVYSGTGGSDGPWVWLGFKPRWLLLKNVSYSSTSWAILDTARDAFNVGISRLFADQAQAEDTSITALDVLSNSFKIRSANDGVNRSGTSIIFGAFAESPSGGSNISPACAR